MARFVNVGLLPLVVITCGGLGAPLAASADPPGKTEATPASELRSKGPAPSEGQAPDPRTLGAREAILDYCTKADPSSADRLQVQILKLARGVSPEALAKVRDSDEYRQARALEEAFVSKVDPRNAHRLCGPSPAGPDSGTHPQ